MLIALLLCLTLFSTYSADEGKAKIWCISNLVEKKENGEQIFDGSINEEFFNHFKNLGAYFVLRVINDNGKYKLIRESSNDYIKLLVNDRIKTLTGKVKCNLDIEKCEIVIDNSYSILPHGSKKVNNYEKRYKIDLKNACYVIFKLISTNNEVKYILTTPDFYCFPETKGDSEVNTIFKGTNYKEISIEHVFGDIDSWKSFYYMFSGCKTVEKISIKNYKYNFSNAGSAFDGCTNLTTIDGLKNIFGDNLSFCNNMFDGCKSLKFIDISGIKMPRNCKWMFYSSGIKNINMTNVNFENVVDCNGMFSKSDIENIDFSNVQNLKPIIFHDMFLDCHNLKNLNLNGIDFSELDRFNSNFWNTPNLKTIDLSMCKFNSATVLRELDKGIILPNDQKSAHVYLKELQKSITGEGDMKTDSSGKVIYKNVELNNLNKYDDLNAFITNPKEYLNNRQGIIDRNRKISKIPPTRNITPSSGPCCGCCLKCCSNCCGNTCGD